MACQSSMFSLLMVAERTPMRSPICVWLRIRASSGETTRLGPAPSSRSRRVAIRYTMLLPHPVRWTTSTRRLSSTRASMASS